MDKTLLAQKERLNFTKYQIIRLVFGIGLLLLIGVVYLPYLFFTYSSNAVVSARIITLTTPIDGIVSKSPPAIGTELHQGDVIAEFINTTVDRSGLSELKVEQASLIERVESLEREQSDLGHMKEDLQKSKQDFIDSRVDRIDFEIKDAEQRYEARQESIKENSRLLNRKKELHKKGNVSTSSLDNTFYTNERAIKEAESAKLEKERLEREREYVQKGIFINKDGRSEVVYQEQRIDEINIRLGDIQSRINEYSARISANKKRIQTMSDALEGKERRIIRAPGFSVVLRSHVMQGTQVDEKVKIVDLIDCTKVYIDMTIHEGYFEKIKIGERATIKLRGSSRIIHGKVTHLRGGSVFAEPEKSVAGVSPVRRPHEMQVIIEIDREDLYESASDFCHVGRTGEVTFDRTKLKV